MQSLEDQTQSTQAQWKMLTTLKSWSLSKKWGEIIFQNIYFSFLS